MPYLLSQNHALMDVDFIHAYLARSYWSKDIRRDLTERAIKNSIVIGAFDESTGKQVSFARVVTDRATFAWLCDVFVIEEHRGHGLSKMMVEALLAHPDLQTLRRWVLATKDAHGLYTRYGFEPVPDGRWLEKRLPVEAWQEP
ncbi:MAG TPA: GNAT family N-acetyltransferase [Phycisphaerales bacterium]|nr:GNAT family N-acetyltransferase [Phycisphaerales bacterium]